MNFSSKAPGTTMRDPASTGSAALWLRKCRANPATPGLVCSVSSGWGGGLVLFIGVPLPAI